MSPDEPSLPSHDAVLLNEAVDALMVDPAGRYVDGTFGRGGHSREILSRLDAEGMLLGIDQDPEAIVAAKELESEDERFRLRRGSFSGLKQYLQELGWNEVQGVLLDLGVSSPQLDDPARGFSFRHDGPLDMRMDPESGESAAQWLAHAEEDEITYVLKAYGEERFARRIARRIVETRAEAPLTRTCELVALIEAAVPFREKHKHPATRSFQAIRIYLNRELEVLDEVLAAASEHLAPGGRLVVISFHSLEDRRVKRFMRDCSRGPQLPRGVPVTADQERPRYRTVGKQIKAGQQELERNPRARSAVMRVLEARQPTQGRES